MLECAVTSTDQPVQRVPQPFKDLYERRRNRRPTTVDGIYHWRMDAVGYAWRI
jgi:hypothetical protein